MLTTIPFSPSVMIAPLFLCFAFRVCCCLPFRVFFLVVSLLFVWGVFVLSFFPPLAFAGSVVMPPLLPLLLLQVQDAGGPAGCLHPPELGPVQPPARLAHLPRDCAHHQGVRGMMLRRRKEKNLFFLSFFPFLSFFLFFLSFISFLSYFLSFFLFFLSFLSFLSFFLSFFPPPFSLFLYFLFIYLFIYLFLLPFIYFFYLFFPRAQKKGTCASARRLTPSGWWSLRLPSTRRRTRRACPSASGRRRLSHCSTSTPSTRTSGAFPRPCGKSKK
jgi:hypothetical protein